MEKYIQEFLDLTNQYQMTLQLSKLQMLSISNLIQQKQANMLFYGKPTTRKQARFEWNLSNEMEFMEGFPGLIESTVYMLLLSVQNTKMELQKSMDALDCIIEQMMLVEQKSITKARYETISNSPVSIQIIDAIVFLEEQVTGYKLDFFSKRALFNSLSFEPRSNVDVVQSQWLIMDPVDLVQQSKMNERLKLSKAMRHL
jgi:hypothetical protein